MSHDDTAARLLKWCAAFLLAQITEIPTAVWTLIGFMALDLVTGVLSAWANWSLKSQDFSLRRGTSQKLLILTMLLVIHWLQKAANLELGLDKIWAFFYVANEALSIIENVANAGVVIPPGLVETLERFKKITIEKPPIVPLPETQPPAK